MEIDHIGCNAGISKIQNILKIQKIKNLLRKKSHLIFIYEPLQKHYKSSLF